MVGSDQHQLASITQSIDFDLGSARSADFSLKVPQALRDLHLTSDGKELSYKIADSGNALIGKTGDGREIFRVTLDEAHGQASYTFTLKDNLDHNAGLGQNIEALPFDVVMKTSDRHTLVGRFNVEVVDDVPKAVDDFDTVRSVKDAVTSGNVNSGIDTDHSAGADLRADTSGADNAVKLTQVAFGGHAESFANAADVHIGADGKTYLEIDGEHGRLTIKEDGSYTYKVTDADAGQSETVTIDINNYSQTDDGFHVSAKTLDASGNYIDGQVNHYSGSWGTGFGVEGNKGDINIGVDEETGYVPKYGKSEQVIVDFDKDVQSAQVTIDTFFDTSVDARVEVGKITAFMDGQEVGSVTFQGRDHSGDLTVAVDFDHNFDRLVFEGLPYKDGQGGITTDSSDYLIRGVSFTTAAEEISDKFTYTIVDRDGDTSQAVLGINVDPAAATAEQNLGVTMGDQQGLNAAQDEFTFGSVGGVACGGPGQDGWTELVLDTDGGLGGSEQSGWSKPVKGNVEVTDNGGDKASDSGEENKPVDHHPDSICW